MPNHPEQSSTPDRKTMEIKDLPDRQVENDTADSIRGGATAEPCIRPIIRAPLMEPCIRPIGTRLPGT